MKHILARAQRELLAQYAWSNVVVALDFDGTLSPIVEDPAAAQMRPLTHRLLRRVASSYSTVVISGRGHADVSARLDAIPLAAVVGNHGVEPSSSMEPIATRVREWMGVVYERVSSIPGVEVEDKRYSLAVHYRRSRARKSARTEIERIVTELGRDARIVGGKCVVNVVHQDAPHKGFALLRLRQRLACDRAIFVGDDTTDEDVFAMEDPGILGIRIGRTDRSRAPFYLQRQDEMDDLLDRLASLRADREVARRVEYL